MSVDWNDFQARWSGRESIFTILGIVVGGIASLFLFLALQQRQLAETSLRKERILIQNLQHVFVHISLSASPLGREAGYCYLQIDAAVHNAGNKTVRLNFRTPSLKIANLSYVDSRWVAQPSRYSYARGFSLDGDSVIFLREAELIPGERSTYPYLVRLSPDSVYLAEFSIPVDPADTPTSRADSLNAGKRNWVWAARTYLRGCEAKESKDAVKPAPTAEKEP